MQMKKLILEEGNYCTINSEEGNTLASIRENKWETRFFNRKCGIFNVNHELLLKSQPKTIHDVLDELILFAGNNNFQLIEYQCDISGFNLIAFIEEKGFRLVDTKITFLSKIEKPITQKYLSEIGTIGLANDKDLEGILNLTHMSFTNNPEFLSRFKNRRYYNDAETAIYYAAWINKNFKDKNTLFAVIKDNEKVICQLFFKPEGFEQGIRVYRAMFAAVDPKYRGFKTHLALISFLCNQVKENTFYLDSTTQLTNFPLIKNNIRSKRLLKSITLIFYRIPHRD